MGVSAAVFESAGKRTEHYIPGAYSRQNNITSPGGVSAGNLCILGEAQGAKPLEILEFGTVSEAKLALGGGSLLEAVAYAFNGSNEYIPQRVYALPVNKKNRATLVMNAGDSPLLKIPAWDYGVHTNQLKTWVKTGSVSGSKTVTTAYKDDTVVAEDIIHPSISVIYVGEGTNPIVTITSDELTLSHVVDNETLATRISLEEYSTLSTLVARINDTGLFSANVVDSNVSAASLELDTVSGIPVATTATFYSNFAAFVTALKGCPYFEGEEIEILDRSTRTMPNVTEGFVYFTGGTTSPATVSDYIDALELLETKDIQIISTPSTDPSVQTLIKNHCVQMCSTVNRKERTCLLGGAVGESDDDAMKRALALNSEVVSYVSDNPICSNPLTGETETVSGAMLAVMLGGMEAAMAPNEALTNKDLNVLGFIKSRTITNMERLIKNGVLVCNADPEDNTRNVCIRSLTTYQQDDLIYNERSMVREAFVMNRELRAQYKPGIGRSGTGGTSELVVTLKNIAMEWVQKGYIIPSDSNENVWDIHVRIDGDKKYLTYSRYLAAPNNFVFVTVNNHVYTSTQEL